MLQCVSMFSSILIRRQRSINSQFRKRFARFLRAFAFTLRVFATMLRDILGEIPRNNEKYSVIFLIVERREKHHAGVIGELFPKQLPRSRLTRSTARSVPGRSCCRAGGIERFFFPFRYDIQHTSFVCFHPWCRFAVE